MGCVLLRGCEADIIDLDGNIFGHDIFFEKGINWQRVPRARTTSRRWPLSSATM
jgi:hypothetical protein